jgi:hypothetical protein
MKYVRDIKDIAKMTDPKLRRIMLLAVRFIEAKLVVSEKTDFYNFVRGTNCIATKKELDEEYT